MVSSNCDAFRCVPFRCVKPTLFFLLLFEPTKATILFHSIPFHLQSLNSKLAGVVGIEHILPVFILSYSVGAKVGCCSFYSYLSLERSVLPAVVGTVVGTSVDGWDQPNDHHHVDVCGFR